MTCADVNDYLLSGRAARGEMPRELEEHLAGCAGCRALYNLMVEEPPQDELGTMPSVEAVLESLEPARPLPSGSWLMVGFFGLFAASTALLMGWLGTTGSQSLNTVQSAGVLLAVVVAGAVVSWYLSREMVPGSPREVRPAVAIAITLGSVVLLFASLFPWEMGDAVFTSSWKCFRHGFLMALPVVGIGVVMLSRGTVLSVPMVGAAVGLLAGLVSLGVLHVACTMHTAPHLMIGHFGVPLLASASGWAVGKLIPAVLER